MSGRTIVRRELMLDARAFAVVAPAAGIRESAQTLILTGRLVPVTVGRRRYYMWRDLLALMPTWARRQHAALRGGAL